MPTRSHDLFKNPFKVAEDTEILRIALSLLFLRCALSSHHLKPHNIQQTQSHQSIYKRSENVEILKYDAINTFRYLTINTLLSLKRFSWLCWIYKVYVYIYIYMYIYIYIASKILLNLPVRFSRRASPPSLLISNTTTKISVYTVK